MHLLQISGYSRWVDVYSGLDLLAYLFLVDDFYLVLADDTLPDIFPTGRVYLVPALVSNLEPPSLSAELAEVLGSKPCEGGSVDSKSNFIFDVDTDILEDLIHLLFVMIIFDHFWDNDLYGL